MELKKGLFFGSLAVAMMAMTSCSQDEAIQPTVSQEAAFSTSIRPVQTRIDAWSGSEQVGVYMVSGSELSMSNVAYDVAASGDLTAAVSGISYPASGNVAFKAYYPYASSNGSTVAIDLTDANTADHDLIFAETAAEYNAATTDKVPLTFRHQLAKLSLKMAQTKITTTTPVITYKVNGLSEASFDVATGTVTNGTATAAMTPNSNGDIIVLPGKSVSSVDITIAGQQYTWDASNVTFTKNMQSKYALSIGDGNTVTATLIASIEDWTQDDGQGDVDPQPEGQKIADVRALAPVDQTQTYVITEDMTVTGSVIATNTSGNFYNAVIISDGEAGLYLYDTFFQNSDLVVGDEITIDLKGATLGYYNGLLEVMKTGDTYGFDGKITKKGTKKLEPIVISASDLANYESMFVAIEGASVLDGKENWSGSTSMTSTSGEFVVYNGSKSIFATVACGTGTGVVSGVMKPYKENPQLTFITEDDYVALNGGANETTLTAQAAKDKAVAAGELVAVSITTNGDWTAVLSNNTANATLSQASGSGDASVNVVFPENTEAVAKSVTLTVSVAGHADAVVTITQAAKSDSEPPASVVTFPVTFDFATADASNGTGVYPATGDNSVATFQTYGANSLSWTAGYNSYPGYVTANGFNTNSGWEFTLPVSNLAAGTVVNFKGEMRSSNTAPGKFIFQYSVDGGNNFVPTTQTIELDGKDDYHTIDANLTITEGLASGNLIIRVAVSEDITAGAVHDSTYSTPNIAATGTNRFSGGTVVISVGADS